MAAGAYGSHGLAVWATATQVEYFQLAVTYQLFHAIALLAVCALSVFINSRFLLFSQIAFLSGICLFSGSLYLYVLTGTKMVGAITLLGGICLIVAWLAVVLAVLKRN